MRIDKFLWCVRYFKSRSLAKKNCNRGRVKINGQVVKPASEVFPGDTVDVRKNQIDYRFEVLELPKSRRGAKWMRLFIQDITPKENLEKQKLLKYEGTKGRKRGTGRPTKKERRDLEEWHEEKKEDWFEEDLKDENTKD